MPRRPTADRWDAAVLHLRAIDERWRHRIERVGPCTLAPRPASMHFTTLVRAIVGQQISTKAAQSIHARLQALAESPAEILDLEDEALRGVGLSARKVQYVRALSKAVHANELPLSRIGRWSDERIIEHLTALPGIGVWTAQMFLIFSLNRPDVLPVGDLGIRAGFQRHFQLPAPPHPRDCHALAEPWRPHRTVAMWYLWRELDLPREPASATPAPPPGRKPR